MRTEFMIRRKCILISAIMAIISLTGCGRERGSMISEEAESAETELVTETISSEVSSGVAEGSEQGQSEFGSEVAATLEGMPHESEASGELEDLVPQLPESGRGLDDFTPKDWEIMDRVELDFNEDGVSDYVAVMEAVSEEDQAYPRILFAIASDETDGYRLDFQNTTLIRTRDEGGVFGDPYVPLTADGVSFTTHAYGGSAWRWSEDNTYTYREGVWWLTASEDTYGYGGYVTSYSKNDWESGVAARKKRSSEFSDMEAKDFDTAAYDVEYELSLDGMLTLEQVAWRSFLVPDRVMDWEVGSVVLKEGMALLENEIKFPGETCSSLNYCDEDCILYTFSDEDRNVYYLAMYSWHDKILSVLAEEETVIDDLNLELYKGKIYYTTEIVENVAYKTNEDGKEQITEEAETVGIRLNRINSDGTGKETIFEYCYPGTGQEIMDDRVPYLSLNYEISGDEIVAEVYIGNKPHPLYRMRLDGSDIRKIGQIPQES